MILHLPSITGLGTGPAFTESNNILTGAGHYACAVINPPKAGTISTITGNSGLSSGAVDVRIETHRASSRRASSAQPHSRTASSIPDR